MSIEEVKEIGDGRILTGIQAQEAGLVDELGDFEEALALAEQKAGISDATVIEYKATDFWSLLTQSAADLINPTAKWFNSIDATPGLKLLYIYEE